MKTTIIGANSYIARNMIAVNAHRNYSDLRLYDHSLKHLDDAENYHVLNVLSQDQVNEAVRNCNLIYFFVGKTGTIQGFDDPDVFLDINEKTLFKVLNACRYHNPHAKIVFPSTRLVYQGMDRPLKENDLKEFKTPYAIQKYACEQYLSMYQRLYGIDYCVLRICVPYGSLVQPVSSYGTLDSFIRQATETGYITVYGTGSQRRTFTHIQDLCELLWRAGLSPKCKNEAYNIGGQAFSIKQIAQQVALKYNAAVISKEWPEEIKKIESGDTVFDATKLETLLEYKLSMNIEKWLEERNE